VKQFIICVVLFIVFVTAGALTAASNKVLIQQILGPGATATGGLLGWLVNGTPAFIKPGTNLSIDASGNLNAAGANIPAGAFVDNALLGTGDGLTKTFTLTTAPNPTTSLSVWVNGLKQLPGATNDYSVSGTTVTFVVAPPSGANVEGSWRTGGF
jgi:hypothetical protein